MGANASHRLVLDGYLRLVANLPFDSKLDLIAKLSAAVKSDVGRTRQNHPFARAFGAFESAATAEEIIAELRASRTS